MTRLLVAFVLASGLFGRPVAFAQEPAAAFDQLVGQPVTDVRFEVEGANQTTAVLTDNVTVRVREPLRVEDVRASIVRLSVRFESVAVFAESQPGGVRVLFRLMPRHPISRVAFAFTAAVDISVPDLESNFRRQFGGLPTSQRVTAAEETVRRLMVDQGFIDAQVRSRTVTTRNPDRSTLVFDVTPGELALVGTVVVRLTGRAPITREAILARARVTTGQPYRRRALQTAMVALQDELRQQGYYATIAASSDERALDSNRVNITIVVDTGQRVELRFEGDSLPSSIGRLDDLVPVKRLGSVDLSLLEDAQRNIAARLRNAGYKDARVTFAESDGADGSRVITFAFTRGPRVRIARVVIPDGLALPTAQIRARLAIRDNSPFSEAQVHAGITRVIVDYQQLGYARAAVTPVYEQVPEGASGQTARVTVNLVVEEGLRHQVRTVQFERPAGAVAGAPTDAQLQALMGSRVGGPYVAATLRQDQATLEDHLRGRGFRSATVAAPMPTFVSEAGVVMVDIQVRVDEGVQVRVGSIVVVGTQRVSETAVRDEITLREGQPFGEDARLESQRRLQQMGVFGTVRIEEEPRLRGEPDAAVIVSVIELPRTTMGLGGGLEARRRPRQNADGVSDDALDFAPRGFFEIGRRGLGGRNQSINLFTRVALKRPNLSDDSTREDTRYGFSEYRLTGTYRERRAFRTDTDVLFGITAEQAIRTNFNFVRQSANAELLRHVTPALSVTGRYVLDVTELFDEKIPEGDQFEIDRLFPQVRLSAFGVGASWDRRNNPFAPSLGTLMSADLEVAPRSFGSEVGYVKTFMQASAQRPLDASRRNVLAGRVQVGLARGFDRLVDLLDDAGAPVTGNDGLPVQVSVADIPASQRFFAGGGTTVRGFQLDRLGADALLTPDGLSNGGNALLIFNVELRRVVRQVYGRNMAAVVFADAGNVFRRVFDVRLTDLRTAVGFGVRYDSPVGPLRLDFGFKTKRLVFRNGARERGWEYHLSIGEVF